MKGSDVASDDSTLTGESYPNKKNPLLNEESSIMDAFLYSGTKLVSGDSEILMLAVAVGENTFSSKIIS